MTGARRRATTLMFNAGAYGGRAGAVYRLPEAATRRSAGHDGNAGGSLAWVGRADGCPEAGGKTRLRQRTSRGPSQYTNHVHESRLVLTASPARVTTAPRSTMDGDPGSGREECLPLRTARSDTHSCQPTRSLTRIRVRDRLLSAGGGQAMMNGQSWGPRRMGHIIRKDDIMAGEGRKTK